MAFIEKILGFAPDNGSGSLEAFLILVVASLLLFRPLNTLLAFAEGLMKRGWSNLIAGAASSNRAKLP